MTLGRTDMGFLLRWGGIFLGALSIFSLMQKLGTLRVAPVFGDMLNFYRTSLYPVEETLMAGLKWLFAHFSLALPIAPPDIVILYTLCSLAIVIFEFGQMEQLQKSVGSLTVYIISFVLLFVWPLTVIINIVALLFSPKLGIRDIFLGWDTEIAKIVGSSIALLGVNAYLLT